MYKRVKRSRLKPAGRRYYNKVHVLVCACETRKTEVMQRRAEKNKRDNKEGKYMEITEGQIKKESKIQLGESGSDGCHKARTDCEIFVRDRKG